MKKEQLKIISLFLFGMFVVVSCKSTPEKTISEEIKPLRPLYEHELQLQSQRLSVTKSFGYF